MTQRVCPFCGASIPRVARTCAICGQQVPEASEPIASPHPAEIVPPAAPDSIVPGASPNDISRPVDFEFDDEFFADTTPDKSNPFYRTLLHAIDASLEGADNAGMEETSLAQEAVGDTMATVPEPPVDTDLGTMIGAQAVVGAYSAGVVGLFMPLVVVLAMVFEGDSFLLDLFLGLFLGAIIWIPASVVAAIVMGIGGLVLGLGMGIIGAILFRLARGTPESFRGIRVLMVLLNSAVFGYAIYWFYMRTAGNLFPEFTALPVIFGLMGALAGLVLGLIGPEKLQADDEPLSEEELQQAKGMVTAPFRFWRHLAGASGTTSVDFFKETFKSNTDPDSLEYQQNQWEKLRKESERLQKEYDRELKKLQGK